MLRCAVHRVKHPVHINFPIKCGRKKAGTLLLFFLVWCLIVYVQLDNESQRYFQNYFKDNDRQDKPKYVLYWTKFFDSDTPGVENAYENCPISNCVAHNVRFLLNESDAIIFHDYDWNKNDLPGRPLPHQRWIYLNKESYHRSIVAPFDWTMTYRTDSDIPWLYEFPESGFTTPDSELPAVMKNKTKLAAWFVSHCGTSGGREDYVKELKKHMPVDIYGRCGDLKCPKSETEGCNRMLSRDYKFYLSFENSFCRDYVTEKLWTALANDAVAVVYGAVDYSQFAPPGSYIDHRDFASPKHLADYLIYLDGNQTAYEQYFDWRKRYVPRKQCSATRTSDCFQSSWCRLCQMLHDPSLPRKNISTHIDEWMNNDGPSCGRKGPIPFARPEAAALWTTKKTTWRDLFTWTSSFLTL